MGVGIERDVREAEAVTNEEGLLRQMAFHQFQRGDPRLALGRKLAALRLGPRPSPLTQARPGPAADRLDRT